MSVSITAVKEHLVGLSHGGTLNKVRNPYPLLYRAGNNMRSRIGLLETIRTQPLAASVHTDLYNYQLPTDFDKIIALIPQDNVNPFDDARRVMSKEFDLKKMLADKTVSIEGNEGSKFIRINWKTFVSKILNAMESLTANGTWAAVAGATNVVTDEVVKTNNNGSIRFDVLATGDGISNTTMSVVDLTDESQTGDILFDLYIKNAADLANFNAITAIWGNDITTKFWTGSAQTTQADGTAFRAGWNTIKVSWVTAVQTGVVAPATIDSLKFTVDVDAAITQLRIDNVRCSNGRPFDIKYYSKYLFRTVAGAWIQQPTSDDDMVVCDDDSLNIYLYECLMEMAHQTEGEDSTFDMAHATRKLFGDPDASDSLGKMGLYAAYRAEHPIESKKATSSYGGLPRLHRGRMRG